MFGAVDLLASEYGWSYGYILKEMYPEDFFLLQRQIRMRKLDTYLMDAAIVANPHKNPEDSKEFIENLLDQRRFMSGEAEVPAETDFAAIDKFKKQLQEESLLVKAK